MAFRNPESRAGMIKPPKNDAEVPIWRRLISDWISKGQNIIFGTPPNYSQFESDGTLVAHGDATCWDDLVGALIGRRLSSTAGKVDYDWDENAITMQSGGDIANSADRIVFSYQFPHKAKTNSSLMLHIHWEQTSTNKIEWSGQYRVQSNNETKTTTWTSFTANSTDNSVFTYTSGTLNQITELAEIDMTGASISATVQFRLARTDSTAGDIDATFVDAHYEIDTFGSREEYVK